MPYRQVMTAQAYGTWLWNITPNKYCQDDRNASDYGKCYNVTDGKALFWETNPVPCEADGVCIRVTTYAYKIVTFDGTGTGKQAIHIYTVFRENTNWPLSFVPLNTDDPVLDSYWLGEYQFGTVNIYPDLFLRLYWNRYYTPVRGIEAWIIFTKTFITDYLVASISGGPGRWVIGDLRRYFSYEVSPVLLLPLDYPEYLRYPELRRAVAYSANNAHPGWNASDIINIAKQLFPDRPWIVADDRSNKLYLYGLTADDITREILELAGVYSPSVEALRDPFPVDVRQAFVSRYKRQPSVQPS